MKKPRSEKLQPVATPTDTNVGSLRRRQQGDAIGFANGTEIITETGSLWVRNRPWAPGLAEIQLERQRAELRDLIGSKAGSLPSVSGFAQGALAFLDHAQASLSQLPVEYQELGYTLLRTAWHAGSYRAEAVLRNLSLAKAQEASRIKAAQSAAGSKRALINRDPLEQMIIARLDQLWMERSAAGENPQAMKLAAAVLQEFWEQGQLKAPPDLQSITNLAARYRRRRKNLTKS